jgi:hypothetical protein
MRALVLVMLLLAGCRRTGPLPVPSIDGGEATPGADLARPLLDCRVQSNCYGCCTAQGQSGALAFTAAAQQCACQEATCKRACAQTVCGAALGIDQACRDCIAGIASGSGACAEALRECVETAGACGRWRSCVDGC